MEVTYNFYNIFQYVFFNDSNELFCCTCRKVSTNSLNNNKNWN